MRSLKLFLASTILIVAVASSSFAGMVERLWYPGLIGNNISDFATGTNAVDDWNNPTNFSKTIYFNDGNDFTWITYSPIFTNVNNTFADRGGDGPNYGSFTRGYIEAPQTGTYTFFVESDDSSQFWLSTDLTRANAQLIASVTGSVGLDVYNGQAKQKSLPINLVRGQKYYFEMFHKQGGGGDHFGVGWQLPDGTIERPMSQVYLAPYLTYYTRDQQGFLITNSYTRPQIITYPTNLDLQLPTTAVVEHQPLLLSVTAGAAQPTTFRWYKNNTLIPGENLSWMKFGSVDLTNNGQYKVSVSNAFGVVTSSIIVLTATPDIIKPTVTSVQTYGASNIVQVKFSEPVSAATALNIANYSVVNTSFGIVGVSNVAFFGPDQTVVNLTTGNMPITNTAYNVSVANVKDTATTPNTMTNSTFSFVQDFGDGQFTFEMYLGINNGDVASLTGAAKFTAGTPDVRYFTNQMINPGTSPNVDNFGYRYFGFLIPPVTGNYLFFISSDDNSRLNLSTDDNPANKRQIAIEPTWSNVGFWNAPGAAGNRNAANPENRSAPIALVAGQRYYIEALQKEGGGGDNLSVTWVMPGPTNITNWTVPNGPGTPPLTTTNLAYNNPALGQYVLSTNGYLGVPVTVLSQTGNQTNNDQKSVTFSVTTKGTGPVTYQWYRNNLPIPDAFGATYTIPQVRLTDNNAIFSVIASNGYSSATTTQMVLTVLPDTTPPTVTGVSASGTLTNLLIKFSETMDITSATNMANYSVSGLTILSAGLSADLQSVALTTSPQTPGAVYSITLSNLLDSSSNSNMVSTTTSNVTAWVLTRGFVARDFYYGPNPGAPSNADKNLGGTSVDNLLGAQNFPDFPDHTDYLGNGLNAPQTANPNQDNFGARLHGLISPPADSFYTFFITSDDSSSFYLSTDSNPANLNPIPKAVNTVANSAYSGNYSGPIRLFRNQQYYYSFLYKEGGGGDVARAIWMDVNTNFNVDLPFNGSPYVISQTYLSAYANPVGAAVTVTVQPTNITTFESGTTNFVAVGLGTVGGVQAAGNPISYIWQKAFASTPNTWVDLESFGGTYTTPRLMAADNGARFRALVSTPGATTTSAVATVTLIADTTAPTVLRVFGDESLINVHVTFSEPVEHFSSIFGANYDLRLTNGTGAAVFNRLIQINDTNVILTTTPQTALIPGQKYVLTISGVTDQAGAANPVATTSIVFTAWALAPGHMTTYRYDNIANTDIGSLTASPKFPDSPDAIRYPTTLDWPIPNTTGDFQNNYGTRSFGFINPTVSGAYTLYLYSDDSSEFRLSTTASTNNLPTFPTIYEPGCCNAFSEDQVARPTQTLKNVNLNQGQLYYFEVLQKEGGGGDYVHVGWRVPGDATAINFATQNFWIGSTNAFNNRTNLLTYMNPDATLINITSQPSPVSQTVGELSNVTYSVSATITNTQLTNVLSPSFQWMRNGTNIPGATSSSLSFNAKLVNNADTYQVAVYGLDPFPTTNFSRIVSLNVNAKTNAPVVLNVGSQNLNTIGVVFGGLADIGAGGITTVGNYTLDNGGVVTNVIVRTNSVLAKDGQSVILQVSGATNNNFNLTVKNITDLAATPNVIVTTNKYAFSYNLVDQDIGTNFNGTTFADPVNPGSAFQYGNGQIEIRGGGSDVWQAGDMFNYAWERKAGDFDVRMRVLSLTRPGNNAKVGLFVRDALTNVTREIYLTLSPTTGANTTEANARLTPAVNVMGGWGGGPGIGQNPPFPNAWVRIQRVGSTFNGYRSSDGTNWFLGATSTIAFTNTAPYVGIGICANNNTSGGTTNTAVALVDNYGDLAANPLISAKRTGNNLTLNWTANALGYRLQASPTLIYPFAFTNVDTSSMTTSNQINTLTVPIAFSTNQFFRLIR